LNRERQLVIRVVPVDDEDAGKMLLAEDALRNRGRPRGLKEEEAQSGRAEQPGIAGLAIVPPACFIGMPDRILPVGFF